MLNVYGAAPQPSASPTAITAAPVAQRGVKTRTWTPPDPPPQNPFGRRFQPQDTQLSVRPSISRTAALRSQRWSCGLCRPPSPPTAETPPPETGLGPTTLSTAALSPSGSFRFHALPAEGLRPTVPHRGAALGWGLHWGGGCPVPPSTALSPHFGPTAQPGHDGCVPTAVVTLRALMVPPFLPLLCAPPGHSGCSLPAPSHRRRFSFLIPL